MALALRKECAAAGIHLDYHRCWEERRALWHFSIPAVLDGIIFMVATWAANAILVNRPNGYAEMGLYNAANQFRMLILFVPNIIGMVTIPLLTEIYGGDNPEIFVQALSANIRTLWSLALPLGFLAIGFSSWLTSLFGTQFHGVRKVLALIVCFSIVFVVKTTVGQALIASGKMWIAFLLTIGWSLIFLPMAAYWSGSSGAAGLSLAYFISCFCLILASLIYLGFKFGWLGVRYAPALVLLTCIVFLLASNLERLPEAVVVGVSLAFACITAVWGWRIMPMQGKDKIVSMIHFRASCSLKNSS